MLRLPVQCVFAFEKAFKQSVILCRSILSPWPPIGQTLIFDSTCQLANSLLKRPGERTRPAGILCNDSNSMNQFNSLLVNGIKKIQMNMKSRVHKSRKKERVNAREPVAAVLGSTIQNLPISTESSRQMRLLPGHHMCSCTPVLRHGHTAKCCCYFSVFTFYLL